MLSRGSVGSSLEGVDKLFTILQLSYNWLKLWDKSVGIDLSYVLSGRYRMCRYATEFTGAVSLGLTKLTLSVSFCRRKSALMPYILSRVTDVKFL